MTKTDHEREFECAWKDPGNTRFEWPPIEVNRVLEARYSTSGSPTFTRAMMWDMEALKASKPDIYIPSVVRQRSAHAWGKRVAADGTESFSRSSQQRRWLASAEYGLVLEQVHLAPAQLRVTFIGAAELQDEEGRLTRAGTAQPLFHVQHSVGGDETHPSSNWRIVHLTDRPLPALIERFTAMAGEVWLPEFIEIYIRRNLNIELRRSHAIAV